MPEALRDVEIAPVVDAGNPDRRRSHCRIEGKRRACDLIGILHAVFGSVRIRSDSAEGEDQKVVGRAGVKHLRAWRDVNAVGIGVKQRHVSPVRRRADRAGEGVAVAEKPDRTGIPDVFKGGDPVGLLDLLFPADLHHIEIERVAMPVRGGIAELHIRGDVHAVEGANALGPKRIHHKIALQRRRLHLAHSHRLALSVELVLERDGCFPCVRAQIREKLNGVDIHIDDADLRSLRQTHTHVRFPAGSDFSGRAQVCRFVRRDLIFHFQMGQRVPEVNMFDADRRFLRLRIRRRRHRRV